MLFTNIQLDNFSPTLARLPERLSIEEPEAQERTMMAAINIGALLENGRPQDVSLHARAMGQRDPAAVVAVNKVMLVREAQADRTTSWPGVFCSIGETCFPMHGTETELVSERPSVTRPSYVDLLIRLFCSVSLYVC
jgi:hypothetical protein